MSDISDFASKLVDEVRSKEGERVAAPAKRNGKRGSKSRRANGSGGASVDKPSGEPLGTCPKCGSPVVETQKAFGCSAWRKSGCKFAIWKTVSGKRVSEAQAKQLLTKGRTSQLKGFKSKAGKPFSAALTLDGEYKVRLEFENER